MPDVADNLIEEVKALRDKVADLERLEAGGAGVSSGVIALADAACPSGWAEYTAAQGRVVVGVPSGGTVSGTVGSALANLATRTINTVAAHTHTYAHTHGMDTQGNHTHVERANSGGGGGGIQGTSEDQNPANRNVSTAASGAHAHTTNSQSTSTSASTGTATVDVTMPYIQLRYCKKD